MLHNTLIINAINDNGQRTSFRIQELNDKYSVTESGYHYLTADDEISARNAVECIMKDNGWHMEELVNTDDASDFSTAITFDPVDQDTVIIKVFEWMGGRYVQLGPEERYSAKLAGVEYGYC